MNYLHQNKPGIRQASSTPSLDYAGLGADVGSTALGALGGAFTSGSAGDGVGPLGSALAAASAFIFGPAVASGFTPGLAGAAGGAAFDLPFASLMGPII